MEANFRLEAGDLALDTEQRRVYVRNGTHDYIAHGRGFTGYTEVSKPRGYLLSYDAYRVLKQLVNNQGRIVLYTDLLAELPSYWRAPRGSLSNLISQIRFGLEDAKPGASRFLETITKKGYRLTALTFPP